jgi:FkbM family methyltransferase
VENLMSSGVAIAARSKLRQHPRMQRTVVHLLSLGRSAEVYEHSFKSAMLSCIRPGDCVWDVGANVGFYSELFALAVGPSGKVVSFEPSPACVAALEERLRDRSVGASWVVVPIALSDADGDAWLSLGDGDIAPSNHLANGDDTSAIRVKTARGDSLLAQGYGPAAVIKIDVEGFEGEVLDGMNSVLADPSLRAVCVEVHFSQLEERGKPNEPTRIARLLHAQDFTLKWVDRSRFIARR